MSAVATVAYLGLAATSPADRRCSVGCAAAHSDLAATTYLQAGGSGGQDSRRPAARKGGWRVVDGPEGLVVTNDRNVRCQRAWVVAEETAAGKPRSTNQPPHAR